MNKKRLVFFAYNLEIGGIEKALVELLKSDELRSFDITLFLQEKKGTLLSQIDDNVTILTYKPSDFRFKLIRKIINFVKMLVTIALNYHRYDHSICYTPYVIPFSLMAPYFSKKSTIYLHTDYVTMYGERLQELDDFVIKRKLNQYNQIVFVSNEARKNFVNRYGAVSNLLVINNLINPVEVSILASEEVKGFTFEEKTLINVARHVEDSKQISKLIYAMRDLIDAGEKVRLLLIGDGPNHEDYIKLVEELCLVEWVTFLGELKNPYPYMRHSDLLVLTSKYEGFPVIFLEALVLHTQVASTVQVSDPYLDTRDYMFHLNRETLVKDLQIAIHSEKKCFPNYLEHRKLMVELFVQAISI